MARQLSCPCGTVITDLDATFVASVQTHLAEQHPGREYDENQILMMSTSVPDRLVPGTLT